MKKALLILALFFMTASSSFAYTDYMSVHGFGESGNCEEHLDDLYVNVNANLNYVSLSGYMTNAGECEAFYYAGAYISGPSGGSFNYYYPYFDSNPTFTQSYPADYYTTFLLGMGAFGCDAYVTLNWG